MEQHLAQINADRTKLYWHMIAHGMLPSQGWRCAERHWIDERNIMHYKCWALHPKLTSPPA